MENIFERLYKPDVLSCLADLSNDEIFTPPDVANRMLDLLPQELFRNKETKILDPACKSGVFLREAAKRFISGERDQFDSLEECLDWIFKNQLYGIAITELTSLLSRRSVYCSKYPNSPFSVIDFGSDNVQGNIMYHRIQHSWVGAGDDKKCSYCGAAASEYKRSNDLETHAYEWIHTVKPGEIWNMKFDVIISNPPYQLSDGGNGASAKPIYQFFVEQSKKLNPKYLVMITPSRWFNGGKGLDKFRETMLNDGHITKLIDYQNAKDCFPGISIGGGVSYFLRERDRSSDCEITNVINGRAVTLTRPLNQYPVFVRYNEAISIIEKIKAKHEESVVGMISSRNPFGLATSERGSKSGIADDIKLFSSKGVGFVNRKEVHQGEENIDRYKIMISRVTSEHAGEPDKDGTYKVIAKMQLLNPGEICTDSYVIACPSDDIQYTTNFMNYLKTKFARFLILQSLSAINLSRDRYEFVPMQDFQMPLSDDDLYAKYELSDEEIDFIESQIKPMESAGDT